MGKGEETRDSILDTALDQASLVGLEGLSIGDLAKKTGLSKSGLFAHFGSKEALQVEILRTAVWRFAKIVVAPAQRQAKGIDRLRALFENLLDWTEKGGIRGGCIFLAAAVELDDREGLAREFLVESQLNWLRTLTKAVQRTVREGDLGAGVNSQDFAYEIHGIYLAYHQAKRLLHDPGAKGRALRAFETLIANNR
ncbi:MAG: TetR/AcrR family transcriptional regulator [Rhodospirillales bacterium]|nr:TetR/AcrR family transcriptional regulator [Rhodospirillales bacterium]MDH3911555.1 TetR/AcrR family transcriptional regulator [Rhodospirillales bacterium]MDH3918071.1 TetR/AcrR family transcriptional regulator [Rhodospirillales bacterium]MDH3967033.1 TetR/AcrR family transcriptional regulator [Rhodospirillales bacterium]